MVLRIPEQRLVSSVWSDMVDGIGHGHSVASLTLSTERKLGQPTASIRSPLVIVTTSGGGSPVSVPG